MVNIGVRPTVSQNGTQHIEAHLFNFNQDLYGQKINLIFLDRMREEKLFSNQSELIRQLQLDAKQANEIHERLH
jgi:riboflavin kinase/FMN adenylyltransferase